MNINKIFPYKELIQNYQPSGNNFQDIGFKYAGPILFMYVWWVILEAQKKNIKRLYFIARDGYPLYEIAKLFVEYFNINIECRYLYCSRKSLMLPSLINSYREELYNLTKYSIKCTLNLLLDRINATETQKQLIINSINYNSNLNKELTIEEHKYIQQKLISNKEYTNTLIDNAKKLYNNTIHYLEQEKLFANDTTYIVDIGWAGSIQKYLNKLAQLSSANTKIHAFYFGALNSEYLNNNKNLYKTWFFENKRHILSQLLFNINVMERICTAPHGTTEKYEYHEKICKPKLQHIDKKEQDITNYINSGIFNFTKKILPIIKINDFKNKPLHWHTFVICYRLMVAPNKDVLDMFGNTNHCDDITNSYSLPLISMEDTKYLHYYQFHIRLFYKLFKKKMSNYKELVWPYGAASKCSFFKKIWYRINIMIIYYFRMKKEIK